MTKIEWCHIPGYKGESWNPVSGCTKVSPGCAHCYAERMAKRLAGRFDYPKDEPFKVTLHPEKLAQPLHWQKPRGIFVCSMSDLFHEDVPDEYIDRVFAVAALTPQHIHMILTKRPERGLAYLDTPFRFGDNIPDAMAAIHADPDHAWVEGYEAAFPLPNIWMGTSVESPDHYDRIHALRQTPAAVRFISLEPLLADVPNLPLDGISWVIAGGESGPHARPSHPDWFRGARDQCKAAGVPFFFKQWGEYKPVYSAGDDPNGRSVMALPDGTVTDTEWNGGPGQHLRGSQAMYRMSNKRAQKYRVYAPDTQYPCINNDGRSLLDGREHSEWPRP